MLGSRSVWPPLTAIATLALFSPTSLSAQAPEGAPSDRAWFTVGAGFGTTRTPTPSQDGGLAAGATLSYQPGPIILGLSAAGVWTILHGDMLGHAAALVGLGIHSNHALMSLTVGPALTGGQIGPVTNPPRTFHSTLGLTVHAQMLGSPLPSLGGGLSAFANFNHRRSYGGVMLTFAFGQLR